MGIKYLRDTNTIIYSVITTARYEAGSNLQRCFWFSTKSPIFENFQHGFRVLVYFRIVDGVVNDLVDLITQNPGQRKPFLAEKMGISERTIQRWLTKIATGKKN
jgi:hypothetical protein